MVRPVARRTKTFILRFCLAIWFGCLVQAAQAQSPLPDRFDPGADDSVWALAVQSDGRILVGGWFTVLGGQPCVGLGRLNADGTLDEEFDAQTDGPVCALAVQADGKILVGGRFTSLGGKARNRLARLNADGTSDDTFDAAANEQVSSLALQADGKILVGGGFTTMNGQPRGFLAKLNADGTLDSSFNAVADSLIRVIALQADGKILVGGGFTTMNGQPRSFLARLNAEGTLDTSFTTGANNEVITLVEQADEKILVGGSFTTLAGTSRNGAGRLNSDGSLDLAVDPQADSRVYCILLQANGSILLGGSFTRINGQGHNRMARLLWNGQLDTSFNPSADNAVYSLAAQADGKVLTGGSFSTLGGQSRSRIARLNSYQPAMQSLTNDGSTITWRCSGSIPEFLRTSFECRTNGATWTKLGAGVRITGGWKLDKLSLPANSLVRAQGYVAGAIFNGSGWFVEKTAGPLTILNQPWDRTNHAATKATLRILAAGTDPLVFRWEKDGVFLADGGNISGATTDTLSVSNVFKRDEGGYRVIVSDSTGSATSAVARLTVVEPLITRQPISQNRKAGEDATFDAAALGTSLTFQWWKDDAALARGTNATLQLTNLNGFDAGKYTLVVSNSYGSVTSAVAILTVIDPLITAQPANLIRKTGENAQFSLAAAGTALQFQWWKDGLPVPRETNATLSLTNLQANDAGHYFAVISNSFGSATSALAALTINLATFDPGFNSQVKTEIRSMVVQRDGRILTAGWIATYGSQTENDIVRLNRDGTMDPTFSHQVDGSVKCMLLQEDDKLILGGYFTSFDGQPRTNLVRLNADGTLDRGFSPSVQAGWVEAMALQADGKIVLGGNFGFVEGRALNNLARLNADGTLDTGFTLGVDGPVYSVAVQADGKVLVGGNFHGSWWNMFGSLGRLNPDGTFDTGFKPRTDGTALSLAVQSDGKILVGGMIYKAGGQTRFSIARLHGDGTLDVGFDPEAVGGIYGVYLAVKSIMVQANGKIVIGGNFTTVAGESRNNLARLHIDGSLDEAFSLGSDNEIVSLGLQGDGSLLVGCSLNTLTGEPRPLFTRICDPTPTAQELTWEGSWATWKRSGNTPEVWRTAFDYSTNGSTWTSLGPGTRVPGGWRADGLNLQPGGTLRARGFVTGGRYNGSSWSVENSIGPPAFVRMPADQTNNFGTTATFGSLAVGNEPFGCQWWKDGVAIAQATNATLTVTNVFGADAGGYWIVVTNPLGSATSAVARLSVIDPLIINHPANATLEPGQATNLSVGATGTALQYQWWKDGSPLPNAEGPALSFANVHESDLGHYWVVVSNMFGSVTSLVALLSVNQIKVDSGFAPGPNNLITSVALQADGKILVGGLFTTLGGKPRNGLARLEASGALDETFHPDPNGAVDSVGVQEDGKIVVAGAFSTICGQSRLNLARLNSDGTLDTEFNAPADSIVKTLAIQSDGKVIVGGVFTALGGQPRTNIGRLNIDGSVDQAFNPTAAGSYSVINALALQADGKILVGGVFTAIDNQPRTNIARLNANGDLDPDFKPNAVNGDSTGVYSLTVQPDGKIILGGSFLQVGGEARTNIARLNVDGTLDLGFEASATARVHSLAVQGNEQILIGGWFAWVNGQLRRVIARLNSDGTLDPGFCPQSIMWCGCATAYSLAIQPDGGILAGGSFSNLAGQQVKNLARLIDNEESSLSLIPGDAGVTWQCVGGSAAFYRTRFDLSTNGHDWTLLGEGDYLPAHEGEVTGRWVLKGIALPAGAVLRARGFAAASGASWFIETQLPMAPQPTPSIVTSDGKFGVISNRFGFTVRGTGGQVVVVECSRNLKNWIPRATNTIGSPWFYYFSEPYLDRLPYGFYRARLGP